MYFSNTYRYQFSCDKLRKRGNNEVGTYIFRQSSQNYEEYKIDLCYDYDCLPETFILAKNNTGEYNVLGIEETFSSIGTLLNFFHHSPLKNNVCLKECLPPSEYGKRFIWVYFFVELIIDLYSNCTLKKKMQYALHDNLNSLYLQLLI